MLTLRKIKCMIFMILNLLAHSNGNISQSHSLISVGHSVSHPCVFPCQLQLNLPHIVLIADMFASLLQDTTLIISLWSVLSDRGHWGDPEVFRPERFLYCNGKFVKDEWMVNFGTGKRFCVGESLSKSVLFLFFATFLQEFSLSVPEGEPRPTAKPQAGFTTAPFPFRMKLKQRM